MKDAAYVASLHQCTPELLQQLHHDTLHSLLDNCPRTKAHLAHLVTNIGPALWEPILQTKPTDEIPRHRPKNLTHMVRSQGLAAYQATLDPRGHAQLARVQGLGSTPPPETPPYSPTTNFT